MNKQKLYGKNNVTEVMSDDSEVEGSDRQRITYFYRHHIHISVRFDHYQVIRGQYKIDYKIMSFVLPT
jgi:hypothetical protein